MQSKVSAKRGKTPPKTVQTPTKLKDITLGQYIRYDELAKEYEASKDPNRDYVILKQWFGQDFSDMPVDVADAFINEWVKDMTDVEQIKIAENESPPKRVKIKGEWYEVPQNMEHQCNIAQFVDYSTYQQTYEGAPYGFYAIALAIFLKKQGQPYRDVKLLDRIETVKSINLIDAVKITSFFFIQSERYRRITSLYLNRSEAVKPEQVKAQQN